MTRARENKWSAIEIADQIKELFKAFFLLRSPIRRSGSLPSVARTLESVHKDSDFFSRKTRGRT